MKRIAAIALVLGIALAGCMSLQMQSSGTVDPGDHNVLNVSVSENLTNPHLCYTATANGSFDALVYSDAEEYAKYTRDESSSPIAALSSVDAHKENLDPDVDLGTEVEPTTHHIVIDNTDYDAIETLESGSPSAPTDAPIQINVTAAAVENGCP